MANDDDRRCALGNLSSRHSAPAVNIDGFDVAQTTGLRGRRGGSQLQADGEDAALMAAGLMFASGYTACGTPVRIFGGAADIVDNHQMHGRVLAGLMTRATYEHCPGSVI
ncbi:MAG: hypothetical protein Q8M88_04550 [Phenylobacterium sp.]|uniref:hypothetical protein n=1 Tax=Phenylobacterium sp. TaxID=1871053 RepID=UPI002734577D|nr:hypothetical protein [Phenylobacterium sp.]MDP3173686.1 hypothetical protein [Phenylobacterium sp.]